ncbi:MAG: hypothetical protein E6H10_02325 [Bacteroidetes bacterium]|nr:MAG: hypothetical protein E6H10_02325 [Bacteroidota bacterium]
MRSAILLLVLSAVVLGGCTSAYKTGQTPDDVYYSPARQHDEYVKVKENDDQKYGSDDQYYDDRYLHMKVHNRMMWSDLDDYYYYNPRYSYSYYNSLNWNNPWTPFTYWNSYYNPYCSPVVYTGYSKVAYSHPRIFNLNTYNNNQLTNNNYTNPKGGSSSNYGSYGGSTGSPKIIRGYTPSNNSNSGAGNFLRNIFNGSGSSNNSSNSPSSSSGSSRSSSSSSSGSSGGSAPVRRF